MFKNEDDFKTIVNRLNIDDKPNPAHRESLRGQMLSAFNEGQERIQTGTRPLWRTIMKSPIGKLAAAAVIIIAVLVGIHQFDNSVNSIALANVIEAMNKAKWAHYHYAIDVTGVDEEIAKKTRDKGWEGWQSVNPLLRMAKLNNGKVYFTEENEGKTSRYDPKTNTITIVEYEKPSNSQQDYASIGDLFIKEISSVEKEGGKVHYEEGIYEGCPVIIISIDVTSEGGLRTKMSAIVEPETYLPKKVTAQQWKNGRYGGLISGTFDYPKSGPENIYALGVPQTAKIIDTRAVVVAEAKNEPKFIATPEPTTGLQAEVKNEPKLIATPEPTTGPQMAPLPIKLPRPMFVGTPQDIKVERLEKPLGKPRPPFYAPVGTKNVAFGKRAASTDEEPIIGEIEMITDGDKEGSDGSYVELGPFKQHITIDLGAEHNIYAIVVWHFHKNPCVYFDVVVQISSEPNFVKPKTVFNNDIDNSLKFGAGKNMHYVETSEGKLIDAKGTIGRYVRLYSQGNTQNDLNHYIEVEVYGKNVKDEPKQTPDEKKQKQSDNDKVKKADPNTPKIELAPLQIKLPKPMFVGTPLDQKVPYLEKPLGKPRPPFYAPVGTKNVAFEKPVNSTDEEPIIGEIELITDGDKEGADGSFVELGPTPQHITIDLKAMHEIYAIVVWHYHKEAWIFFDVAVQVADDADFIMNVRTLFNNDIDNSLGLGVGKNMHYVETSEGKLIDAKGTRARYLRLHSNGSNGSDANHYIEVEVYGKAVK
ncbi:MAG: hypothetical protein GWN67_06470 [Phycisphaerae bacterium]|nr:hypothetical protein [Phycisphaerae bacterium]NIP51605.1 hypothetical protein [Phycisphaerae bacterium]NIS50750.1 hypothetical protein [Phycisphaerae bacterium]NIU08501.1 hypothetical protein [Phycisphaerae bacterium]NIU56030.1 hypothetical protein [Phycisphaerae bacterium]